MCGYKWLLSLGYRPLRGIKLQTARSLFYTWTSSMCHNLARWISIEYPCTYPAFISQYIIEVRGRGINWLNTTHHNNVYIPNFSMHYCSSDDKWAWYLCECVAGINYSILEYLLGYTRLYWAIQTSNTLPRYVSSYINCWLSMEHIML